MNMQRAPKLQWLKFSAMLLIVGAFISILIYVLVARDELVATNADVPLIQAAQTPVKRRPENPGGLDIPNRDRVVFDLLASQEEAPTANEPEAVALTLSEVVPVIETLAPTPVALEKAPEAAESSALTPAADAIAALLSVPDPAPATPVAPVVKAEALVPVKTTGNFGVQMASFALKKDADNAAKSYATKHASILGSLTADIQKADLGAKGIRYRVRFIGAASKAAANTICSNLKAKGQGCFAVSK